ncbi:hypothetical protein JTE90_019469 [Oedothorax gibbosus]|uniref:PDZ domain-containing protein n=1 Tax=Oedothorax gibbosus TaxID=931172 RepID=A0AAV6UWJ3_9ARAC|nr:hypothetical protein JTE90_019469 [Oedothorax gibbosus]
MTYFIRWQPTVLLCCCIFKVVAGAGTCYPPGGVAGIVVATVIVTLVVAALSLAGAWKFWWVPRHKNREEGSGGRPDGTANHQQAQKKGSSDFAFDNPYFRNSQEADEQDGTTGRNKSLFNNKNSLRSSKLSEASAKAKKARGGGKNHFGFGGGKKKAQDDSCITTALEPERAFVSLRGHDFTGLGFNICGNMRDGILVKDVLHRGPASESGLIKAGDKIVNADKIVNVTVSFTSIVYEDALTILSYASPYDVQLEIERVPSSAAAASAAPKRLASCSFNNSGQKLFHPLYRSQSIDDLTQIDGGGGGGSNPGVGGTFPSGGPRRSHSLGVAAHFRRKEQQEGKESSKEAFTGSLNEKMLANVMTDGKGMLHWEKRFEDTLDNAQESSPTDNNNNYKKNSTKAHLDYHPPSNLKLETKSDSPRNVSKSNHSGKTVVEVSSGAQNRSKTDASRRGSREDGNDSDVSRDSLEVSHRGFVKRNAKGSSTKRSVPNTDSPQNRSDHPKIGIERMFAKDRQTSRVHSSSLSSNEEVTATTILQESYSSMFDTEQTPKPNVYTSTYSERHQKQQESYNSKDGYGSTKITINGGGPSAEDRSRPTQRTSEDEGRSKFSKKAAPAPAGGMFTQINPFQVSSSKLQQRTRGPWAVAQQQSNGEQPEFVQGRRENIGYSGPKLSLKESSMKHRQF